MSNPIQVPSVLRELQEAVTARLQGASALSGISIYDRRTGDIEDAVNTALSTLGVSIFVSPVLPRQLSANVPTLCFESADFTVRCIESPTTNTTGKDAYLLTELVMRRLHHFTPGVAGAGPITVDPNPVDDNSEKTRVIFDVLFHVSGSFEAGAD